MVLGLTYVLNDVAVVADEKDRAAVGQVDLHAHQAVRVPREVVQRDALAEVEAALVEGLPVPVGGGVVSETGMGKRGKSAS